MATYSIKKTEATAPTESIKVRNGLNISVTEATDPVDIIIDDPTYLIASDAGDGYYNASDSPQWHQTGDASHNNYVGNNGRLGLVFENIAIPVGATITSSFIGLYGFGSSGAGIIKMKITGFAEDNAAVFSADGSNEPGTRTETNNSQEWDGIFPFSYARRYSPDLSNIIQEIVNRGGWASGNNLGFKISDTGTNGNMASADYSGSTTNCANLTINYVTSGGIVVRETVTPAEYVDAISGNKRNLNLTEATTPTDIPDTVRADERDISVRESVTMGDGIVQQITDSNTVTRLYGGSGTYEKLAQSFIAGNTTIYNVSLKLYKYNSPTDNLLVDIVSALDGTSLGNVTVAASGVSSGSYNTFTFGTPITVTKGNTYYIQLSRDGARDTTNNIAWYAQGTGNPYIDGAYDYKTSGTWYTSTITDYAFSVYFNPTMTLKITDRFWVGGSGNWSETAHWSYASNGATGAPVPTYIDNVHVDNNSGISGGTITVDVNASCKNFTTTVGSGWTLDGGNKYFWIYGSMSLGETITTTNWLPSFLGNTSGLTIFTHGTVSKQMSISGLQNQLGGEWTLLDDVTCTGYFLVQSGIFDANDHNITAPIYYFTSASGYVPTIYMGNGTWEVNGSGNIWAITEYAYSVTFIPEGSTIKLTDDSASDKNFDDNDYGKTYNNFEIAGAGTGTYNIIGSNTFNDFKIDTPPHTIKFTGGETTTINSWTVAGTAGNLITIDSNDGITTFYLYKSSGVVSSNYLDISNCTAEGGAIWDAGDGSIKGSSVSGWGFNRYWVGGSGNWSEYTSHWTNISNGDPGYSTPIMYDDAFIDSNSGFGGGGTITLDVDGDCKNFTSNSGHTYTISGIDKSINVYGSVVLESGLTVNFTYIDLHSTSSGKTFTSNGCGIVILYVSGIGGEWTLQDNLTLSGEFYHDNGTFDANDHNVTANDFSFYANTGYTPSVVMGDGVWKSVATFTNGWILDENNGEVVTVIPENSTFKLTGNMSTFAGGNKIYNNLWINGVVMVGIAQSNTFNDFKIDAGATVYFMPGQTQTVTTFSAIGSVGNLITLNVGGSGQFNLYKSSGVVSCDYLDISNSNTNPSPTELIVNGGFDGNANGWNLSGGVSYDNNNILFNGTENAEAINENLNLLLKGNTYYQIEFDISDSNSGYMFINIGGGTETVFQATDNHYSIRLMTSANPTMYASPQFISVSGGGIPFSGHLDNVSVKVTSDANWFAGSHSLNTINNSGWIFDDYTRSVPPGLNWGPKILGPDS